MITKAFLSLLCGAIGVGVAATARGQAPVISTQPRSVDVASTYPTTLAVTVTGVTGSTPTYQWYRDGEGLAGATSRNFVVDSLHSGYAGTYTVVVRNATGSVASAPARLNMVPALAISTIAGRSAMGAEDGPASEARFYQPAGFAIDRAGNMYVTDSQSHTVRKITSDGIVSTLAGTPGVVGNVDGTRAAARFRNPTGITVDRAGTVYVADTGNDAVRKITPDGVVTTLAGRAGFVGYTNATGTAATFNDPVDLVVDAQGNVYVGDRGNQAIRRVTPAGVVTTFAGRPSTVPLVGEVLDGSGTNARFRAISCLAIDDLGNLYVGDQPFPDPRLMIRRISPAGDVTTMSIPEGQRDSAGRRIGAFAAFGLTFDSAGVLHAFSSGDVYRIDAAGIITLLGRVRSTSVGGDAGGIAIDARGRIYFPDGPSIAAFTPAGDYATFAGALETGQHVDGDRGLASFYQGSGIAADAAGNLYLADRGTIRRISSSGEVSTLAGRFPLAGDDPNPPNFNVSPLRDGSGSSVRFAQFGGMTMGPDGNLYVTDFTTVRRVTPAGEVTTIAGDPTGARAYADGTGTSAKFQQPRDIAADGVGNLYVCDEWSIRKIAPGGVVTTFAGNPSFREAGQVPDPAVDGDGTAARFLFPMSIAVDGAGNVYVSDQGYGIRKITPAGSVSTLARGIWGRLAVDASGALYMGGGAIPGYFGTPNAIFQVTADGNAVPVAGVNDERWSRDGTGMGARFMGISRLTFDPHGVMYLIDGANAPKVRRGQPTKIDGPIPNRNPTLQINGPGSTLQARSYHPFTVAGNDPEGDPVSYQWDFGDGGPAQSGPSVTYRWLKAGTYAVRVTARDGKGGVGESVMAVNIAADPALRTWTRRSPGVQVAGFFDLVFGGGQFVAVGLNESIRSVDGVTWQRASGNLGLLSTTGIAYGAGRYVVIGNRSDPAAAFGLGMGAASYSADGQTWSSVGAGMPARAGLLYSVAYGAGRFVAVGHEGRVVASPDGRTWTDVATGVTNTLLRVAYGGGRFVAVGVAGQILVSTDGLNWTPRLVPGASPVLILRGAVHHAGLWYLFAQTGLVYVSSDATNWTRTSSPPSSPNSAGVADGALVLPSQNSLITYSEDARVWDSFTIPAASPESFAAVAEGNGSIVIVGTGVGGGVVYQARALPRIMVQPVSQTMVAGGVTLSVGVSNPAEARFQWSREGAPIPGATSATLVLANEAAAVGRYAVTVTNAAGSVTSAVANIAAPVVSPGRLVNLAIRTQAGTGAQTLIVGVVVGGTGTLGGKPVLFRGIGPSLAGFGVAGFLVDPALTVTQGATLLAANNDWSGTSTLRDAFSQVGAFPLEGAAKDAAVLSPLAPGSYTVQVEGAGGTTGVALAEIYDATPSGSFGASTPRLVNVSTRTEISAGASLVAGFVIGGVTPRTVLVRAIGPTLAGFGVGGVLADPRMELYSSTSQLLAANDNWGGGSALADAFRQVGAFPLEAGAKDAALVRSLEPGSYTVEVAGVGGGGGVALVEIYEVP